MVMVTPADLHDAAAAKEVLFRLSLMHPEITIVWADSACAGKLVDWAKQHLNLTIKPVSRPKDASGFVALPRRWVVERSLAWMMHARRHARDYERLIQHSETLITCAAITLMTRRLARKGATPSWPGNRRWLTADRPSGPVFRILRGRDALIDGRQIPALQGMGLRGSASLREPARSTPMEAANDRHGRPPPPS